MSETGDGGPVDRDVGRLPRYCLRPRVVGNDTLCFRDDYDQHGDWTPWAPAQAELDRLRAENEALVRAAKAVLADEDDALDRLLAALPD